MVIAVKVVVKQALNVPVIVAVGNAFTVTAFCAAAAEQVVAVIVSVTSTAPDAPQVTVIELVPAPAVIEPPTTVQE